MPLTRYHYSQAVSAFFEMPTSDARRILPPHLQPLEVQHECSILAITAFDFTDSMAMLRRVDGAASPSAFVRLDSTDL